MLQQTKTLIKKTIFIVSILTMVFSFSAVAGEKKKNDIKVINFGIISTESSASLQKGFDTASYKSCKGEEYDVEF